VNIPEHATAYISELFVEEDHALRAIRTGHQNAELPTIHVSAEEGKILHLLVRSIQATRVLEVGTLGGYSAVWIARALPTGGLLTTIEGSPKHAAYARDAFDRAGVADRVELIEGEALETLESLTGKYDAVFLDADKAPLPRYYREAMRLLRVGGLLLCDNTYMHGRIADDADSSSDVKGMREFNRLVVSDQRLSSAVIPVRDGLMVALRIVD
jgi:predicted O-methyltransferase YrrM